MSSLDIIFSNSLAYWLSSYNDRSKITLNNIPSTSFGNLCSVIGSKQQIQMLQYYKNFYKMDNNNINQHITLNSSLPFRNWIRSCSFLHSSSSGLWHSSMALGWFVTMERRASSVCSWKELCSSLRTPTNCSIIPVSHMTSTGTYIKMNSTCKRIRDRKGWVWNCTFLVGNLSF